MNPVMTRSSLQFLRRGRTRAARRDFSPRTTVLDWLRLQERSTGTKEGCAEGDCGACAVVVVRQRDGRLVYEPVNSCITLLGQLDGAELITVEDLADDGVLHPVQEAMARQHGSQCGFCTPGIVMSLFAHYHECDGGTSRDRINDVLAGNLCRCTGYRPIVDAALEVCDGRRRRSVHAQCRGAAASASARSTTRPMFSSAMPNRFSPRRQASNRFARLYAQHPDATIVAGATDVGLWITKKLVPLEKIIHVGRVAELSDIEETAERLCVRRDRFAGARRSGARIDRSRYRGGAAAVRLHAGARLRHGRRQHRQRLADRRSRADADRARRHGGAAPRRRVRELAAGRILSRLRQAGSPARANSCAGCWCRSCRRRTHFRAYKITKRTDEDISAVLAAFCLKVDGGRIADARVAFGGMAGIPKRAKAVEAKSARICRLPIRSRWQPAADAVAKDFTPLDRSARQRRLTAAASPAIWSSRRSPKWPASTATSPASPITGSFADAAE